MTFQPQPGDTIEIKGRSFLFTEPPADARLGRDSLVYRLQAPDGSLHALKVFQDPRLFPQTLARSRVLVRLSRLPGLQAARRIVVDAAGQAELVEQHPELQNAILMPWIAGASWLESLRAGPLTARASRDLARALVEILVDLEQNGIAHCALARDHILVDGQGCVSLVDLEDLYQAELPPPEGSPAPPLGYRHPALQPGPEGDRFAAALLLAECLCWYDDDVVRVAFNEHSFFDPPELQQNSPRFQLLSAALERNYGTEFRRAFEQAWFSRTLAECPPLSVWGQLLGLQPVPAADLPAPDPERQELAPAETEAPSAQASAPPRRSLLSRVYTVASALLILLLAAGLGLSLYNLDRVTNLLDRAETRIQAQAKEILSGQQALEQATSENEAQRQRLQSLQSDLDQARTSITDLQQKLQGRDNQIGDLRNELTSANQTISDLEDRLPIRLTIVNEFGQAQFVGIDGIAFIYIPAGGSASFYLKPGSYELMACHPAVMETRSGCKRWGEYDLDEDRTLTITK